MFLGKILELVIGKTEIISYADFSDRIADMLDNGGWLQYVNAKDAGGHVIDHKSKKAAHFCSTGAIRSLRHKYRREMLETLYYFWLNEFCEYLVKIGYIAEADATKYKHYSPLDHIAKWNDRPDQTEANVVAAFRGFAEYQRNREPQKYLLG